MRLGWKRLVLGLVALLVVVASAACSPDENAGFLAMNHLRQQNHVAPLLWNEEVYPKAVAWSNHMADQGRLSHSTLSDGVPAGWSTLGENVAYASTMAGAISALEASAPHRANMLNPAFKTVSVGAVTRNGKVWVTEVFVG
ncbi:MAG: hypothetical protein V7636_1136 [Actinomycetota bacterium]|jgi:uncharacterized protein YkwD